MIGVAGVSAPAAAERSVNELSDEAYLRKLAEGGTGVLVDRRRLAKLFFGVAQSLRDDIQVIGGLGEGIPTRGPNREENRAVLSAHHERYSAEVKTFQRNVSRLMNAPDSPLWMYRALGSGQRACWRLDRYVRTAETFGVRSGDLMAVVASTDSCTLLHEAAFMPQVERVVRDALREQRSQARTIRELREEVRELEQLVDDLAEIELAP